MEKPEGLTEADLNPRSHRLLTTAHVLPTAPRLPQNPPPQFQDPARLCCRLCLPLRSEERLSRGAACGAQPPSDVPDPSADRAS